jgi:hypothetical protein
MKSLITFIRKGNCNQSVGLITIGLAMFAGSNLAENVISDWTTREVVQLVVILFFFAGKAPTIIAIEKERFDVR